MSRLGLAIKQHDQWFIDNLKTDTIKTIAFKNRLIQESNGR